MHPDFLPESDSSISRRSFLKYMGAGALLYGLVLPSCKRANKYLVPYGDSPEWSLAGVYTAYSTCMPWASGAVPMLAVCREGRPVKLEPQSWLTESPGLPAMVQASLLGLYDPRRSKKCFFNGKEANKDEFSGAFAAWSRKVQSTGKVGFVFSENDSPLREQMVGEIKRRNGNARFFSWEPLSRRERINATHAALGDGAVQVASFANAKRILSLDCDFLGNDFQGFTGDFFNNRIPEGTGYLNPQGDYLHLNRLYVAEGRFSMTGGMADERLPIAPSRIAALVCQLALEVGEQTGNADLLKMEKPQYPLAGNELEWLKGCSKDLCANRGQSLVMLGSVYPEALHCVVLSINAALNAPGITLQFLKGSDSQFEPLSALFDAVDKGEIDTLFICCEANPVLDAPAEWRIKKMLDNPHLTSVRLSLYRDETADACTWHIPASHYLESWGIERDALGRCCYRQPVICNLYETYSEEEILNGLLSTKGVLVSPQEYGELPSPVYNRARKCFDRMVTAIDKERAWTDALKSGVSQDSAFGRITVQPKELDSKTLSICRELSAHEPPSLTEGRYELQFVDDYSIYDGRYVYNAWLMECPDPITGLCWDASAQMSAETRRVLRGAKDRAELEILEIQKERYIFDFVVCETPGVPDGVIVLPLGYREKDVADFERRLLSNAYQLRGADHPGFCPLPRNHFGLRKNEYYPVAMLPPAVTKQEGVPFVDAANPPDGAMGEVALPDSKKSSDRLHQWGMCIDTSLCTGCNACLIACQAENNIPIVGREEIAAGRMMHWMRIDRYFVARQRENAPDEWSFAAHPVACQHCEDAPCESVCPVHATTHTTEGVNAMVYPRCWGTRYCFANCPYKARRFNFFDYAKACDDSTRLQRNPNVTVRSRGVTEKCTYCVQRIEEAKSLHKASVMARLGGAAPSEDDLRLPPNAVKTACQLACPAGAITFGNFKQKDTMVSAKQSLRSFSLLEDVGTSPRTSYLAKVRNKRA